MPSTKGKAGGSVVEGLKQMYQMAANLALEPDAGKYMQVIQGLQQGLLKVVQQISQMEAHSANQMGGPMGGGGGQPQQMGGPSMAGMGGPPPGASPGGPGGPPSQGSPGLAMPNPDELRRVLATQGAGG